MQSFYDDKLGGGRNAQSGFSVEAQPDPQGIRLVLTGELDMAAAPQLDRALSEVTDGLHRRLLVDLDGLTFMDSTGLASLIRAQRSADADGHSLALRAGSAQVQKLFALTGMLDRFSFEV